MNNSDPWMGIKPGVMRRVDPDALHELFWIILEDGSLGLLLSFSKQLDSRIRMPKFKNINVQIRTMGDGFALVIGLKDKSYKKIFTALCFDVVNAVKQSGASEEAVSKAVKCTGKWHYFLKNGGVRGLTQEEQRGLVGELDFLVYISNVMSPRKAIEAWQGPMGSAKDFEFPGFCVEVKTRRAASQPVVSISSEHQLESIAGSHLYLRVSSVASGVGPDGMTLHELVKQADQIFQTDESAHDLWQNSIMATGYDPSNDYEDRHWELVGNTDYFIGIDFPRLVPPLPKDINRLRYNLSLEECSEYVIPGIYDHFLEKELLENE